VALLIVLAGWTASLDLSRPSPPATVEVAQGLMTAPNPLTDDEAAELRDQADHGRLRCEPRGCAEWRLDRGGGSMAAGAVQLGDGRILVMVGTPLGARPPLTLGDDADDDADTTDQDDADEANDRPLSHRLLAIDPETGREAWSRPVADYPAISGAYRWVQLEPGPDDGALIVAGTTVTSIDAAGDQRWTATPSASDGPFREVWDATTTDHVVLLSGTILNRSSANRHLTAIDHATGQVRWNADVAHVAALQADQAIVLDPDGTLRGLDDATGATRWSRPGSVTHARLAGPWLAVQEDDTLHLVDPATGTDRATIGGWLTSSLVSAGELWVGTRRAETSPDGSVWADDAGPMELIALGKYAEVVWSSSLGQVDPWWDCCPVRVDHEEGVIIVEDPVRLLHHDPATGELLDAEVTGRAEDVTDRDDFVATFATAERAFGDVDVLVNNAGTGQNGSIRKLRDETWERTVQINLNSIYYGSQVAAQTMVPRRSGTIINISSRAWLGWYGQFAYAATKGAVVSASRSLAIELAKYGITVNCIAPGLIDTPLVQALDEGVKEKLMAAQPTGTIGTPQDVAWAARFLVSSNARAITGQTLYVCGGKSLYAQPAQERSA
jgi:3-oxoacyl-[acyl-carrier protein] reductase